MIAGCGGSPASPHLSHLETRLDETKVPLPFVLALRNSGDDAASISDVTVKVLHKTLISRSGDSGAVPNGFDHAVEFGVGHPTRVEAGEDGVACGFLRWTLPPDPPPMLAVVRCMFVVHYREGRSVETDPVTLVLQSRAAVLHALTAESEPDPLVARNQAAATLEKLSGIPGARSKAFSTLLAHLEKVARSPAAPDPQKQASP